ncbi:MAG TPA: hypothetical protein VG605_03440 [Puia sp.]|nr:hypothetical protein [Puia sp.]
MVDKAGYYKRAVLPVVFLLSFCYLAFLSLSTQKNVYFSGDGGVKSIVVKQIGHGESFKYLRLDQPKWVTDIWSAGYFPLRKPFVYPSSEGYIFSFPPLFQIVNSFFYRAWGYIGLYVLPFFCALLLWTVFVLLLMRCGVPAYMAGLGLAVLVFASPLTIYGAIYWEHMPAVLLLFGGVWILLDARVRIPAAILAGLACGMAVWLRPEGLVMDLLYGLAALALYRVRRSAAYLVFIGSVAAPVIGFLVFNKIEYGALLGVHSYQVLQEHSIFFKIAKAGYEFFLITWTNLQYFPLVLLLVPAVYRIIRGKSRPELSLSLLLFAAAAFCLISPLLMPNGGGRQWGARYLLPAVPVVVAGGVLLWKERGNGRLPGWALGLLAVGLAYSFIINTIVGGYSLRSSNLTRVKPAFDFAVAQPQEVVVVNSENIPMELASLFEKRYFFLVSGDTSLNRLMPMLKAQGIKDCLYIDEQPLPHPAMINRLNRDSSLLKEGNYYFARYDLP